MTTYTTTRAELLFVDVPEDMSNPQTHTQGDETVLVFSSQIQDPLQCGGDMIRIPGIGWTLHPEVTEEVARELVDKCDCGQCTRFWKSYNWQASCDTALESLQSLRTKLNINPSAVLLSKTIK